jgi:hypothetical protein
MVMVMRLVLTLTLLFSLAADAGTVSRVYNFEPNTKAEADQVDEEFDNILSTINGGINSVNIQDGGIATADLGSNAVTTAKILDGAVTKVKTAFPTIASGNANEFCLTASDQAVGCATATMTNIGRPVRAHLVNKPRADGSACINDIQKSSNITVSGTGEGVIELRINSATRNSSFIDANAQCSDFQYIDFNPVAGSNTYQIRIYESNAGTSDTFVVCGCELVVEEL